MEGYMYTVLLLEACTPWEGHGEQQGEPRLWLLSPAFGRPSTPCSLVLALMDLAGNLLQLLIHCSKVSQLPLLQKERMNRNKEFQFLFLPTIIIHLSFSRKNSNFRLASCLL